MRMVLVTLIASAAPAFGQTPPAPAGNQSPAQPAPPSKPPPSTYDTIWAKFTNWYTDDTNPVIQRVLFTGRFHHDFAVVRSDQGDHDESNVRRVRFGPRITFLRRFLFHAEVEVNPQERNPFYMRFTDLYVQWTKSSRLALTVGKQSIPFTQEGATSSRELLTIDRSNLANNIWFGQEYMPGVSVSGTTCAVELPRRRLLLWRGHAGAWPVQRRCVHARRARLRLREEDGRQAGAVDRQLSLSAARCGQYVHTAARAHHVDSLQARRAEMGRAHRCLTRDRVSGAEQPLVGHGACRSSTRPTSCSS